RPAPRAPSPGQSLPTLARSAGASRSRSAGLVAFHASARVDRTTARVVSGPSEPDQRLWSSSGFGGPAWDSVPGGAFFVRRRGRFGSPGAGSWAPPAASFAPPRGGFLPAPPFRASRR